VEKTRPTLGGGFMIRDLRVSDHYQIKFTLEDGNLVCRWTEAEMEFHQKMMNEVMMYEKGENSDSGTKRDISSN
jgi:hypothetical protein